MFVIFDSMCMVEQGRKIQGQRIGGFGWDIHDVARKAGQFLNFPASECHAYTVLHTLLTVALPILDNCKRLNVFFFTLLKEEIINYRAFSGCLE